VLVTHWPWETVLDQMTWSRFKALRKRVDAARVRAGGGDSAPSAPVQHHDAESFKRLVEMTGGKIPGVAPG
jgi:hypothetical protein